MRVKVNGLLDLWPHAVYYVTVGKPKVPLIVWRSGNCIHRITLSYHEALRMVSGQSANSFPSLFDRMMADASLEVIEDGTAECVEILKEIRNNSLRCNDVNLLHITHAMFSYAGIDIHGFDRDCCIYEDVFEQYLELEVPF